MIENMRKYTGLMVLVIVLLAAGLIATMNQSGGSSGISSGFMNVNGTSIDRNDYSKQGKNTIAAIQRLGQMQNFGDYFQLQSFIRTLAGNAQTEDQAHLDFVTNRTLLKQAAEKLGLYASQDAAADYIKKNMFKGRTATHNPKNYASYIESIANLGFKESDFKQLIAEFIVFQKTRDLIGGGLTPATLPTIAADKLNRQNIGLTVIDFKLDHYKKDLNPSEAEVKAYWDTHKDRYKTDRLLAITYALTHVDDSDKPQRPTPQINADPSLTAKLNLEFQEKMVTWTEQRRNHTKLLTTIYSNFIDVVQDSDGKDFDKAAAAAKEKATDDFKIVTTKPFSIGNAPDELKKFSIKYAQPTTSVLNAIFAKKFSADPAQNIHSFAIDPDGHIAVRIDKQELPKTKEFEAAKDLAKADLINKLATDAMNKAANDALKALADTTTSFEAAAEKLNLKAVKLAPFTAETAPTDRPNASDLFRIAQTTKPKTVSREISTTADTATVFFVNSRTFTLSGDEAIKQIQLIEQSANQLKHIAFNAWILGLRDEADLKLPNVR